uniref:Calponin-homology (CH) domain-containing protein n=1 Tax=Cyprinus carpio carpio TaxID=630221 RepID=A0A9J8ACA9_CYPCA
MDNKKKLPHLVRIEHQSERSHKKKHGSQVEQEQIQKRTFTNWINAQLSKRSPPVAVVDLFSEFRDGSRLLDLLEVLSGQRMSREKGRGTFQHRTNIEKCLAFLKRKSIKLVNINVSDIMDGKHSIILGLIWTIIMHFHIEELASTLNFSSRQSSLDSLASLDTRSTSSSARSSPVPPRGSPLHTRFRISAKKALLLWVREQCQRAGCTLNVKDFKESWRSGVVFLAILHALRPNIVDLTRARTRTNRQNLEEAFHIAERELHIPRLLDPADVDVRDPDEKSIMTYVAQFLQYSKDTSVSDEEMQYLTPPQRLSPVNLPSDFTPSIAASPLRQAHLLLPCPIKSGPPKSPETARAAAPGTSANQKAQEVTCWLDQAYQELIEGWDSTEGESYAERYQVFHTFIVSFNEQRRPVMPLLTAMKRTPHLSAEQKALRRAWDALAEKLREYKTELNLSLPSPLDTVGCWLLRIEEVLSAEEGEPIDHARAAEEAREKLELLKVCLEEMPHHIKRFNMFQNTNEFGETLVPADKMEEMKRRFTGVRVTAKYHGIKLEYRECRYTVLDLLNQLNIKLRSWKRAYISQEAVRVLMQDWNETVNKQELTSLLDGALHRLKLIANKYTSKAALAGDSTQVNHQVADLEADVTVTLEGVRMVRGTMGRVLAAWDSYSDVYTSLHAWLEQGPHGQRHRQRTEVTLSLMSEWSSRQAHLNEVANYLTEVTDPQTSRTISDELCKINLLWADFAKTAQFSLAEEPSAGPSSAQTVQSLIREATQLLKEPVEVVSGSLRIYTKRLQLVITKIKDVDLEALSPSLDCSAETLCKLKQAIPEVLQTLCEAEQVCDELCVSVSGLDGRLAELLNWEVEARELYQLLKEISQKQRRGQDPRARLLISRGLQLEGQVVMEEQDLQVMVMNSQKTSPLQYLIASTMQDRVRTAVEKSQEAIGMLSSLGACRDRSPVRDQPPSKNFVQY